MSYNSRFCFDFSFVKSYMGSVINPGPAGPGHALPFANSVDPDQLASEEANSSGFAVFIIQYVNLYQQPGPSDLIG